MSSSEGAFDHFARAEVLYYGGSRLKSGKSSACFLHDSRGFVELGEKEGKHEIRFRYMHKHAGTNRK
jgi:hypothetical protein